MSEIEGTYRITRAPGQPGNAAAGDTVSITSTAYPNRYLVTVRDRHGTPRPAWNELDFDEKSDLECCLCEVEIWDGETHPHVMLLQVDQIASARLVSCRVVSLEDLSGGGHAHPVAGAHYTGSWHGSD